MDCAAFIAELDATPQISDSRRHIVREAVGWVADLAECMRTREARVRCAQRSEAWRKLLYDKGSAAGYCDPREVDTLIARVAGYFDVQELMHLRAAADRPEHALMEYGICACASGRTIEPRLGGQLVPLPQDMVLRAAAFAGMSRNSTAQFEYDIPHCVEEYLRTPGPRRDAFIQSIVAQDEDTLITSSMICASRALFDALPENAQCARMLIMLRIAHDPRDWDHPIVMGVRTIAHIDDVLDGIIVENLLYNEDLAFARRMIAAMDIAHARPVSRCGIMMRDVAHALAILRMYRELGHPFTNSELLDVARDCRMGGITPACDEDIAEILAVYD